MPSGAGCRAGGGPVGAGGVVEVSDGVSPRPTPGAVGAASLTVGAWAVAWWRFVAVPDLGLVDERLRLFLPPVIVGNV